MLTGHTGERSRLNGLPGRVTGFVYAQAYTKGAHARNAFTLVEIMVVLTILAALMAMGFGGFRHLGKNAAKDATRAVVEAVANGIAARGPELSVRVGVTMDIRSLAIWDVDRNGLIDGQGVNLETMPNETLDWSLRFALRRTGYAGLTADVVDIPKHFWDAQGRPIDAWKQPLRYAYAPNRRGAGGYVRVTAHLPTATGLPAPGNDFTRAEARAALDPRWGSKGFVIWSPGPDGIDFNDDDIYAAP